VYNEQRGHYAKLLPYGSNVGAPSFGPTNLTPWKREGIKKINDQLHTRLGELKSQYDLLMEQLHWNELIYSSSFNFEPIVGHTYHLYQAKEGFELSLLSPEEWGRSLKLKWIGSFRLTSDRSWQAIKVAF